MKLIIDIDERAYKACMKLKNNDDMGILGLHLINATANGTPLEEELKKIKEEMWKTEPNGVSFELKNNISELIDEHIAELKGETE